MTTSPTAEDSHDDVHESIMRDLRIMMMQLRESINRQHLLLSVKVPRFSGIDPTGWIDGIQRYFDYSLIEESDRIYLVSLLIDSPALEWFRYFQKNNPEASWQEFVVAFRHHFSQECATEMLQVDEVKQLEAPADLLYDIHEVALDGSLDTNSSNMAKSGEDVVALVSFESEQPTASFATNEINEVASLLCKDSSKSYSELKCLGVKTELQLYNCNVSDGKLRVGEGHIQEVSDEAAAPLDLHGDARTIPPRYTFPSRVVQNPFRLKTVEEQAIIGLSHLQLLQKDQVWLKGYSDAAGLLDPYGDARNIPPRDGLPNQGIPNSLQIFISSPNVVNLDLPIATFSLVEIFLHWLSRIDVDGAVQDLFVFQADDEQVNEGLDRDVKLVKNGVVSVLKFAPEYGFGSNLELTKIPTNSTLCSTIRERYRVNVVFPSRYSNFCSILEVDNQSHSFSLRIVHEPECYSSDKSGHSDEVSIVGLKKVNGSWITPTRWVGYDYNVSKAPYVLAIGYSGGSMKIRLINGENLLKASKAINDSLSSLREILTVDSSMVYVLSLNVSAQQPWKLFPAISTIYKSIELGVLDTSTENFAIVRCYNAHDSSIESLIWAIVGGVLYNYTQGDFLKSWTLVRCSLSEMPIPSSFLGMKSSTDFADALDDFSDALDSCFRLATSRVYLTIDVIDKYDISHFHPIYEVSSHKALVQFLWLGGQQLDLTAIMSSARKTASSPGFPENRLPWWELNFLWCLNQYMDLPKLLTILDIEAAFRAFKHFALKWLSLTFISGSKFEISRHVKLQEFLLENVSNKKLILEDLVGDSKEYIYLWMNLILSCESPLSLRLVRVISVSAIFSPPSNSSEKLSGVGGTELPRMVNLAIVQYSSYRQNKSPPLTAPAKRSGIALVQLQLYLLASDQWLYLLVTFDTIFTRTTVVLISISAVRLSHSYSYFIFHLEGKVDFNRGGVDRDSNVHTPTATAETAINWPGHNAETAAPTSRPEAGVAKDAGPREEGPKRKTSRPARYRDYNLR